MLSWALMFLIIALIAGLFGFGLVGGMAYGAAKICFFIFLVLAIFSLLTGRRVPTDQFLNRYLKQSINNLLEHSTDGMFTNVSSVRALQQFPMVVRGQERRALRNSTVIILIIVAVVAMAFGGWISFNDSGEKASVTIHKEKIKQDTESAVEQGEKLVNKATSKSKELIDQGNQGEPANDNTSETKQTEPAASP